MRVAIACPGLGRIRRGFETFAEDLFRHVRSADRVEAVLFKGAGDPAPSEFPLWNLPRSSSIWRLTLGSVDPYVAEQLTFAISLARRLKTERFDLVHVSDCQVASLVSHLTNDQRDRPRILFSNGGPMVPADYQRFDFIHQMQNVRENAHLLVVGDQSSSESEGLRRLARQVLGGRASFASFSHAEMPQVYAAANLYVHTALYEGFGIVFLEAMASGLPVVHHDERSMNWIVGEGGVATDTTDPIALSETIQALLSHPHHLNHLSAKARRCVEGNFSWDTLLPRYVSMYSHARSLASS